VSAPELTDAQRLSRAVRRPARAADTAPCGACGRPVDLFGRCRRRLCPGYLPRWAGDHMAYVMTNLTQLARGGQLDLITITPPGSGELPWDPSLCTMNGPHKHSGPSGCRVEARALERWHADLPDRLTALWEAARNRLRRMGLAMPEYVVVVEPQDRGGLHLHVATSTRDRRPAAAFATCLRVLATEHGFGRRVAWDPARGRDAAAAHGLGPYLAKLAGYLAKESAGEATGLRELLGAMPAGRRVCRASTRLTGRTRCTMRNLRLRRWAHHHFGGEHPLYDLTSCVDVEHLWLEHRRRLDQAQRERAFLVGLELTFTRPPPWWLGQRVQVAELDYLRRLFRPVSFPRH
jgi:hypothetical protein